MLLLVEDAAVQWRGISDQDLPEAVTLALKGADFMPTNGKVVGCWEKASVKTLELGSGVKHYGEDALAQMSEFDAYWKSLTKEEQNAETEKRLSVCRESRAKLVGGGLA